MGEISLHVEVIVSAETPRQNCIWHVQGILESKRVAQSEWTREGMVRGKVWRGDQEPDYVGSYKWWNKDFMFYFSEMRSHWRVLSGGVKWWDLHFKI